MKLRIGIICLLLFAFFISKAQEPLIYEGVVKIDTITNEQELMMRLKIWLDEAFVNDKEVIQILDEENGQVNGKGNLSYNSKVFMGSDGTTGKVHFKIKIQIKTGRYRYEFSEFVHDGNMDYNSDFGLLTTDSICPVQFKGSPKSWCQKVWDDIKSQTDTKMHSVISNLEAAMLKPTKIHDVEW